jgi:hypothetical protein
MLPRTVMAPLVILLLALPAELLAHGVTAGD